MFAAEVSYPIKDGGRRCVKHFCDGVHGKSMAIEKDSECLLRKGSPTGNMVFCPLIGAGFALITLSFVDEPVFDEV